MSAYIIGVATIWICCGLSIQRAFQHPERGFIDRWDAVVGWLTAATVFTGKGLFL